MEKEKRKPFYYSAHLQLHLLLNDGTECLDNKQRNANLVLAYAPLNRSGRLNSSVDANLCVNKGQVSGDLKARPRHGSRGRNSGRDSRGVTTSKGTDLDHVVLAKSVLDETGVELDNLLDGVEVLDVDGKRVLDNKEGYTLGARRSGEGTAVCLDFGRLKDRDDVGEVDTVADVGLGTGCGDSGKGGRQ